VFEKMSFVHINASVASPGPRTKSAFFFHAGHLATLSPAVEKAPTESCALGCAALLYGAFDGSKCAPRACPEQK
ncbi:hypothetical protein, partial [Salmonella enterica]|uniref:hypothetical protein n=1 Tax=Salmonella enterica TaxID=28901 RepID=UPI00398C296F